MATKINQKHRALVIKVLTAAAEKGLDAKGLMAKTKLGQSELAPLLDYMVNDSEEITVEGKQMFLAESDESDDEETEDAEVEETEDDEEIVPAKRPKAGATKAATKGATKAASKGQTAKAFTMSYPTLDTLDEDELQERVDTGVRAAQAMVERGKPADLIVAELIMRSVGKCRKMIRRANAE